MIGKLSETSIFDAFDLGKLLCVEISDIQEEIL